MAKSRTRWESIFGMSAISFAAFLWALEGTVLTPRLYNLSVAFVVFAVHTASFTIFSIAFPAEYKRILRFGRDDYLYLGLIALFGGVIGTLAMVKALFLVNFKQLSVVVLLQQLQPVFAIILARLLLKEKGSKEFYFWAATAIVASYFLAFQGNLPDFHTGENTTYAAFLALLAAASWGSSTVFGRKMATRYSNRTVAFYRTGFTAAILFVYLSIFAGWEDIGKATAANWLFIGIISLTSGILSMLLYYYGLRKVKAIYATIAELFFPVSAVILDYFVNGSVLAPVQMLSALVLVATIARISVLQAKT